LTLESANKSERGKREEEDRKRQQIVSKPQRKDNKEVFRDNFWEWIKDHVI
jgi:hypothetical protein